MMKEGWRPGSGVRSVHRKRGGRLEIRKLGQLRSEAS